MVKSTPEFIITIMMFKYKHTTCIIFDSHPKKTVSISISNHFEELEAEYRLFTGIERFGSSYLMFTRLVRAPIYEGHLQDPTKGTGVPTHSA